MKHVCVLGLFVLLFASVAAGCGGGGAVAAAPAPALTAPTGAALTAGSGEATLSWEPVEGALGYRVFLAATAGIPSAGPEGMAGVLMDTVPAGQLSHTFAALADGGRYYAAVCAIGDPSDSPLSDEVSAQLAPGPLTAVQAKGGLHAVVLEWSDVPGATRYDVFFSDEPIDSATWSESPGGVAMYGVKSPLTLAPLADGEPYYFILRAGNEAGFGPEVGPIVGTPSDAGFFPPGEPVGTGMRPVEVALGDLDADGCTDMVVADAVDGILTIYRCLSEGPPEFAGALPIEDPIEPADAESPGEMPDPPGRHPLALGDLDGDGYLDLAVGLRPGGGVSVFLGDGAFGFMQSDALLSGANVRDLELADVDEDGTLDMLAIDGESGVLSVWLGLGDGTFEAAGDIGLDAGPSRACVADFDADGHLDVAVACTDADAVLILGGDGSGAFDVVNSLEGGEGPWDVATGDLDGDGAADLVVVETAEMMARTWIGLGDGTFTEDSEEFVGADARNARLADISGNGVLDLVVSDRDSSTVTYHWGTGDGDFTRVQTLEVPEDVPGRIAVGDMNGDGLLDLAVVGSWSGSVVLFYRNP